jgi:hypothetical protein
MSSRYVVHDTATITTQVFKAKLDQLSSFRQLSKEERQQLLLDVKKLLGGDEKKKKSSNYDHRQRSRRGGNKTTTDDDDDDDEDGTMFSTDEDQTQFTLDNTQFTVNDDQETQFGANQTQFTMSNDDDQETQFSSDSQSLLSLIDNVFARKSHNDNNNNNNNERNGDGNGYYNRSSSRRRERTASWSHGGSVDYYDGEEHDGENCMLSMCDSFLSCLICDGKSDAVDMAARERTDHHRSRGGSSSRRKGSRERKNHDTTDEQRRVVPVAYRESSFVMDESVIYSDDSHNGDVTTTVSDNSTTVQDQQSSLLSGWNETTTSPDKVDPSSGVRTTLLMSMEGNQQQLVTDHKEVDNTAKMEERDLQQDVVLVDDSGVGVVVDDGTNKESYEDNIIVDSSNSHVTTAARVSSPTESIDDIISQTEQLSSGKISLREGLDSSKPSSSPVPTISPKKPWKEYTDPTTGLKYYSNGVITTWDRPDDRRNVIIVPSPSMSTIKSQLKNEKKQLLLDSMAATNNGRFKLIRERVGIISFLKRKNR